MLRRFAPAAVLLALVLPASASARVVPLNWHETARYHQRPLVTFTVTSIAFTRAGWTATASFQNVSRTTLRLARPHFGLRLYATRYATPRTRNVFLPAARYLPTLPPALAPGQGWTGTFAGAGVPRRGQWIRVNFGTFFRIAPNLPPRWSWITDHTFRY